MTSRDISTKQPTAPAPEWDDMETHSTPAADTNTHLPPPPPPPPPPMQTSKQQTNAHHQQIKLRSDISPLIKRLQAAPAGNRSDSEDTGSELDNRSTPTGLHFVYGTLMDPSLLAEILDLETTPKLRPAKVYGYSVKLWGQYPAVVKGEVDNEVYGMVFKVTEQRHADRLAEYETKAYRARSCKIQYTDELENEKVDGYCFMYVSNPMDLRDGIFDLQLWLERMQRAPKSSAASTSPATAQ